MNAVDQAAVAAIEAEGLTVHLGRASGDPETVDSDVPFVVYRSNVGDDDNPGLGRRTTPLTVTITTVYAGTGPEQAKWAGELVRAALANQLLAGETCRWQDGQRDIIPDETAKLVDGRPLFYGVDRFTVTANPA